MTIDSQPLSHRAWTELLGKHVVLIDQGRASRVAYADLQTDSGRLQNYLQGLSAVSQAEFTEWSKNDGLAFLINAYNAFTLKLILTRYSKLESIKDLGSLLRSPWKQRFFTLLGQEQSLDDIEHETMRKPGAFDDPRVHMAVNCASIGCPMLREEAYVGTRLDAQLDDQVRRFLSDRTRNRYSAASNALEVSSIFKWVCRGLQPRLPRHPVGTGIPCHACRATCRSAGGPRVDPNRTGAARVSGLWLGTQRPQAVAEDLWR